VNRSSIFLHVWHGTDLTITDNAIDKWRGRLRICAGKRQTLRATIVTIFSHMTTDVSVFVKYVTLLDCFCKLPQIRTSNFCKVVWRHTEGFVLWVLLQIYFSFQQWKNFENPLRIEKVIVMSLVYYFFGTQCICYIKRTMKTEDSETLWRYRAKPSRIKARFSQPIYTDCSYLCAPL